MIEGSNNLKMKSKENLYALFYEIISEIKGCKIEIEEEEFQENIESISMKQLINYIKDSIKLLIKNKIEEAKENQKKEDLKKLKNLRENYYNNELIKYENCLNKIEQKERQLIKMFFQNKLHKEAMENKLGDYMEMEDEFEEMKSKLKYEDNRILNNNKKDNKILNLRNENIILKKEIIEKNEKNKKIENEILNKEKEIELLKNDLEILKNKLEEKEKELNRYSSININITNNNQQSKNTNCNYSTNNTTKIVPNTTKNENNKTLKNSHSMKNYLFKKSKSKNNLKNQNKKNQNNLNYTRNENFTIEQLELISKHSVNQNKSHNNSCNISYIKIKKKEDKNKKNSLYVNSKFPSVNKNTNNQINNNNKNNIISYMKKGNYTHRKKSSHSL